MKPLPTFEVGDRVCWFARRWHTGTVLLEVPKGALPDLSGLPASYRPRFKPDKARHQHSYLVALDPDGGPSSVTYVYRPYVRALRHVRGVRSWSRRPSVPWQRPPTALEAALLVACGVLGGWLLYQLGVGLERLLG